MIQMQNRLRADMKSKRNLKLMAMEKEASQGVQSDFRESEKLNSHYDRLFRLQRTSRAIGSRPFQK